MRPDVMTRTLFDTNEECNMRAMTSILVTPRSGRCRSCPARWCPTRRCFPTSCRPIGSTNGPSRGQAAARRTAPLLERAQRGHRDRCTAAVVRRGDRRGVDQHLVVVPARVRADGTRPRVSQHPRPRGGASAAVHEPPDERLRRPLAARVSDVPGDARVPPGPLRPPPRRDGSGRARPRAVRRLPDPARLVAAQAAARRHRQQRLQELPWVCSRVAPRPRRGAVHPRRARR